MQYRKIHIIGGPGSGKTYSSKKLQKETSLIAYDLDQVFWDQSENTYIRASEELRSKSSMKYYPEIAGLLRVRITNGLKNLSVKRMLL
ncbi:hypothetical protein RT723_01495 [Psychrosphaera aquimarina]|uniref:Uncharacterized protein n=1 Tax=Psychrosphaera aquimarina TaxID=2044854 RepID=A0ABU3QW93_9GAMM|nr:hypothetical protein [Psychrosphaera aquimarina]MDU0111706.1 hypothetical protein [Psychrosphaera aquimarina]